MALKRTVFLILTVIATVSMMTIPLGIYAEEGSGTDVMVYINGELLETDVPAQILDDRTMVPLRAIFERMKPDIDLIYVDEFQIITAEWDGGVLEMKVDREYIHLNNTRIDIPAPPKIVDERVLVPVIVVANVFGANMEWDPTERIVNITYDPDNTNTPYNDQDLEYSRATVQQLVDLGYSIDEISDLFAYQLYTLMNGYRLDYYQHELVWLETLANACKLHAKDMHENNYFSHTSLNADKVDDRVAAQGYTATVVEGMATFTGDDSPFTIAQRWYNNTRQRDTMLQYQWVHYGVGLHFSINGDGEVKEGIVVQIFGRGDLDL